ncbi:SUN domain-containing protein 1 isoform X2 [Melopsittacus undulatus]|uniref:SUN domain-containing protein n=2 Tax=Melopsittacus undulatus TaxID=13146 RepID=A0A8V5GDS8_MELUD|nr:SUN domain-containing protein 1 isoform X1 [Melopsittacus undulatus]XP_033920985.1 SUN domain-containing protein 1 isoform X1 [Melopsittacus undulatus]XP_033920986.1 SUN domain-containing protein 1 isoform X1 [Melopsittacus undulatus]XP_033920987.1 SUN domain-containing protein 1 isoform X1 [Melopsittacus undulatus]XP_033920988.1 SUN domain-containing protein 1 isoform X2 [Melopsittacus undulatus]
MDFSRLHTYTPPQCLPENTGYTYALSSSYSSDALDFETENQIDPVFDSPRMSRRSLRLASATLNELDDARNRSIHDSSYSAGNMSFREKTSKVVKERRSVNKQSGNERVTPRKNLPSSSALSQSSFNSHGSDTLMVSTVLEESSIQEQTKVHHFWGLDDEGDPKGSGTTLLQGHGDIATSEMQTTVINGYTCNECSMLSERKEVLTAHSASRVPSSRIYSRDRSQKHISRGTYFYMSKILRLVKHVTASFASLLVQLFQMVLLKLGYEFRAHSDYCGSMNVKGSYREDRHLGVTQESICDDCKGKKNLETHITDHMQSSWAKRVARTIWHTFSYAGYLMLHGLRTVGTAGWLVSQKVLSLLWLAILSPGIAASGIFRLLRTAWYQLATLMSLLKVFLLGRCSPKAYKLFLLLIPLLFLLGVWFWGFNDFISLLPSLNWTRHDMLQGIHDRVHERQDDSISSVQPPKDTISVFDSAYLSELEKQMAFVSDKCHQNDEEYSKLMFLIHNLQDQVAQMSDKSETLKLIKNVIGQHLKDMEAEKTTDFLALHQEHELRILKLEDLLEKLSAESKGIQKNLEVAKAREDDAQSQILARVKEIELELSQIKSEVSTMESVKRSCGKIDAIHEKVDAQVKDSMKLMLFGDRQEDFPEPLLQWLTSNFVSKSDHQTELRDLELRILKDINLQMAATKQKLTPEVITNAVTNAGISGITEEQVQVIINNALKLYSQDRTGLVDFALESGGGSILSTRCSETYDARAAVVSLFGIPLWYVTQSPRAVIQPDVYPGNCWAFKGSQGHLVIRLSMKIYPTAFTLEHIPKTLSPTGTITSAPRKFSVYGLDDEYQESGTLLGAYEYDQEGEPLQMFPVMENGQNAFQIVELRVLSNWGNEEYTCLYRFRVHGNVAQ